jgi:hypothetical protein
MGNENKQSPQPEIHCPECSTKLSPDLTRLLLAGRTVYCEMCGFPYVGIQGGEVKPLHQSGVRMRNESERQQREDQWDEWRKEWQNIKKKIKDAFKSPSYSSSTYSPQNQYTQENQNVGAPIPPSDSVSYGSYNQYQQTQSSSNLQELRNSVRILNKISPILEILMLVVAISLTFSSIMTPHRMIGFIFMIPLAIFLLHVDTKIFIPRLERDDYQHGGLDMIVVGGFGLAAYGAGLLILIKGILTVILMHSQLKKNEQYTNFIRQNPRNESVFWIRQLLSGVAPLLSGLSICLYFTGINNLLFEEPVILDSIIPISIMGFICTMIFINSIVPKLQKQDLEHTSQGVAIGSIILGGIAMPTSVGPLFLTIGILLIVLIKTVQNDPYISIYRGDIATFGKEQQSSIVSPVQNSFINEQVVEPHNIFEPIKAPEPPKPTESINQIRRDDQNRPIRRFDPATGKLIVPESIPQTYFPPKDIPPVQPPNEKVENQPNRIFSVLDAEVRQKLLELDVSEKEREEIAQNLVTLAKDTQLKYLQEIDDVNVSMEEESAKFISRINKLNLPEDQKIFLIQQLEFMPLTQQGEFVAYLEQTAASTASK